MTFRERMQDWKDWDLAEHALGLSLGLFREEDNFPTTLKHVFWSANRVGDALSDMLGMMVTFGALKRRDEPDIQYQWNPDFNGSWEGPDVTFEYPDETQYRGWSGLWESFLEAKGNPSVWKTIPSDDPNTRRIGFRTLGFDGAVVHHYMLPIASLRPEWVKDHQEHSQLLCSPEGRRTLFFHKKDDDISGS